MNTKPDFQKLYQLAEDQAGYFNSTQAEKAGYSWERLSNLTKTKRFIRIGRGVYRLSLFPSSPFEDLYISLLKSGSHSVISHESALTVFNLSDAMPGKIHVTIPRSGSRRRAGIKFHTKKIAKEETTVFQGLRVTTIPRTIIDLLESGYDHDQLRIAIDQAVTRGMVSSDELLQYAEKKNPKIFSKIKAILEEISA